VGFWIAFTMVAVIVAALACVFSFS